jgi:hypothetical protein
LAWSLAGTLEGRKIHNSAVTQQETKISPEYNSDLPFVHYGQAF